MLFICSGYMVQRFPEALICAVLFLTKEQDCDSHTHNITSEVNIHSGHAGCKISERKWKCWILERKKQVDSLTHSSQQPLPCVLSSSLQGNDLGWPQPGWAWRPGGGRPGLQPPRPHPRGPCVPSLWQQHGPAPHWPRPRQRGPWGPGRLSGEALISYFSVNKPLLVFWGKSPDD